MIVTNKYDECHSELIALAFPFFNIFFFSLLFQLLQHFKSPILKEKASTIQEIPFLFSLNILKAKLSTLSAT